MMAIAFNWIEIITWLLLIGGGIGSVGLAIDWAQSTKTPNAEPMPASRSSDAPPPAGAVEWVQDIFIAMGGRIVDGTLFFPAAGPSPISVLEALAAGESRDDSKSRRIDDLAKTFQELEGPAA